MAKSSTTWSDLDPECRREQREILVKNQFDCCAWCERKINIESSHIDHVESRHLKPQRTFDHSNIVASCGKSTGEHCGHARTSASLPKEIDLYVVTNIQRHFRVSADGALTIEQSGLTAQQASEMNNAINDELNLNCNILKGKRARRLAELNKIIAGDVPPSDLAGIYLDFLSLSEQACNDA